MPATLASCEFNWNQGIQLEAQLALIISYNLLYTRNTKICEPLVTFCFQFYILKINLCTISSYHIRLDWVGGAISSSGQEGGCQKILYDVGGY